MTVRRSLIAGCGAYLPERCVTNVELAARLDTSDEWIASRTGIRQRYVAAEGECTSDLATAAARAALARAGLDAADVDLIVLATATPDRTFPATATRVQARASLASPAPHLDSTAPSTCSRITTRSPSSVTETPPPSR